MSPGKKRAGAASEEGGACTSEGLVAVRSIPMSSTAAPQSAQKDFPSGTSLEQLGHRSTNTAYTMPARSGVRIV
jgi:hypothetical protein